MGAKYYESELAYLREMGREFALVHPSTAGLLAERGIAAIVEPAPELLPREARVLWDQGYDRIDLQQCIAQALACVAAHTEPQSEETKDEQIRYG